MEFSLEDALEGELQSKMCKSLSLKSKHNLFFHILVKFTSAANGRPESLLA